MPAKSTGGSKSKTTKKTATKKTAKLRTLTTWYFLLERFQNPRFGTRRMSGICPPSNPGRTLPLVRERWPFCPRPAVLPQPDPCPRPLRFGVLVAPRGAGKL